MKRNRLLMGASMLLLSNLALSAYAAPVQEGLISIKGAASTDEFKVYQILEGTGTDLGTDFLVDSDFYDYYKSELSNWSDAEITDENKYSFAFDVLTYTENRDSDKKDFATELSDYVTSQGLTPDYTLQGISNQTVPLGYYIILDGELAYPAMLGTVSYSNDEVSDLNVTVKANLLEMKKEIYHNEWDSTDTHIEGWQEVGDNEIGQDVRFRITSELPSNDTVVAYTDLGSYVYLISDKMESDKFSFNPDSLEIYTAVNTTTGEGAGTKLTIDEDYTLIYGTEDFSIIINLTQMLDITQGNPDCLYIYFDAELLETADIASENNENTASLVYSNDSTVSSPAIVDPTTGEVTNSKGDEVDPFDESDYEDKGGGLGFYDDIVFDYTFQVDINKIIANSNNEPLAGAVFGLFDDDGQLYLSEVESGVYKLDRTLNDTATDTTGVITTDYTGKFSIIGLDDETDYIISEVKAPDGYNDISDMSFRIAATYDSYSQLNSLTAVVLDEDGDPIVDSDGNSVMITTNSTLSMTIENSSGFILPSTGGVGTTMFHAVGASMLIAAGVFCVAKKQKKD